MSAADSSNLIDSPAANKLGFYRGLLYSEEQGTMEKFRPYGLLSPAWLSEFKTVAPANGDSHASGNGEPNGNGAAKEPANGQAVLTDADKSVAAS